MTEPCPAPSALENRILAKLDAVAPTELSPEAAELADVLEARARLKGEEYEVELTYTLRAPDGTKLVDGVLSSRDRSHATAVEWALRTAGQAMRVGDG